MEIEYIRLLYLFAILVGTSFISLSPFIRKKPGPWDHRYTLLLVISYVAAMMVSFILYSLNPLIGEIEDPITIMAAGFSIGLASKPLLEEIWKHFDPDWWS